MQKYLDDADKRIGPDDDPYKFELNVGNDPNKPKEKSKWVTTKEQIEKNIEDLEKQK